MLIIFKGKGCKNCPFFAKMPGMVSCGLSGRADIKNDPIPKLKPHIDVKPEDCPFATYSNTLEVVAWESD